MEQETNYKERMLIELINLVESAERLRLFLQSLNDKPVDDIEKEKIDLMYKQLNAMVDYRGILSKKIILEMK